jgi:hypothetical protein
MSKVRDKNMVGNDVCDESVRKRIGIHDFRYNTLTKI